MTHTGRWVSREQAGPWIEHHPNEKMVGQGTYSSNAGEKADDWAYFPDNED